MSKRLVLATASPRRIEMLKKLGVVFQAQKSGFVEPDIQKGQKAWTYVEKNAVGKAAAIAPRYKNAVVVGSDTVVVYRSRILGKPRDMAEAFRYIRLLNGRTHSVYTGLAVMDCDSGQQLLCHEQTRVTFRALTKEEIAFYLDRINPLDKAGAYAIQDEGALIVRRVEGCYYNVVGFPLARLEQMLLEMGLSLFEFMKAYSSSNPREV